MAVTKVSEIVVGSGGAASIEFTNIPQTGKDLLILLSGRNSGTSLAASVRPNSATTNLSARRLTGNGTTASSQTDTSIFAYISASTQTANTFGNTSIYISNYASASAKSFSLDGTNENSATDANQILIAGLWNQTTAISSLALVPLSSGTFEQYSTASLYIIS